MRITDLELMAFGAAGLVAGLVTDGLVRDLVGILDVDIPVYCAGLTANSPARNGPGTVGLPIVLGGLRVESGDIVVGDRDGVVIVPLAEATNVLGRLGGIKAAEASLEAKVKAGLEVPEFIQSIMDSGRTTTITPLSVTEYLARSASRS